MQDVHKCNTSLLTPWLKIDALTLSHPMHFIYPERLNSPQDASQEHAQLNEVSLQKNG